MPSADVRVILSHQDAIRQVRERVTRYALDKWNALPDYRDANIERFIAQVVPVVESGQKRVGQITNAYLASMARLNGVTAPKASAVRVGSVLRNGVDMTEVYRRPAVSVYTALSDGRTFDDAVRFGADRLQSLIATDMQLANTNASFDTLSRDDRVIGYERVLNESDATCELCVIASTQMYSRSDLMPIHPGCQCDVAPVYRSGESAVRAFNDERYLAAQERLRAQGITDTHTGTGDNKDKSGPFRDLTQVKVRDHGEYGPTLTWADQQFTSVADI